MRHAGCWEPKHTHLEFTRIQRRRQLLKNVFLLLVEMFRRRECGRVRVPSYPGDRWESLAGEEGGGAREEAAVEEGEGHLRWWWWWWS